jgi:hypothetical protein
MLGSRLGCIFNSDNLTAWWTTRPSESAFNTAELTGTQNCEWGAASPVNRAAALKLHSQWTHVLWHGHCQPQWGWPLRPAAWELSTVLLWCVRGNQSSADYAARLGITWVVAALPFRHLRMAGRVRPSVLYSHTVSAEGSFSGRSIYRNAAEWCSHRTNRIPPKR